MKAVSIRRKIFVLGLLFSLAVLAGIRIVSGLAQAASQQSSTESPWEVKKTGPRRLGNKSKGADSDSSTKRVIENQIPAHLPIEVELLNLKKEPLLRNLQIKVTNTADKPIYFLELDIVLPDVLSEFGHPIVFPLRYGRGALIDFDNPVQPDDVPLRPGESFLFKAPEENVSSFERLAAKGKLSNAHVKKVFLIFQQINFGDKTGFSTTGGLPVPRTTKEGSSAGHSSRFKNKC